MSTGTTTRRKLLTGTASGLALAAAPPFVRAAPYRGRKVVVIRFGGGVRRLETIEPDSTWSPWMLKELAPRGTLYRNMVIDDSAHIETSHGQGTIRLLTGRYDRLDNLSDELLGERFEPPAATLFEYLRAAWELPSHETLIINGEDRAGEEFYTFSNDHQYGVRYRSEVLSLFRYKTWLLRQRVAENRFDTDEAREAAHAELAKMQAVDVRRTEADGQGPVLDAFWERWRGHYGDEGFRNARGDRLLTELALGAMQALKPRLMLLNYQDPDYVHWGYPSHYTRAIAIIDRAVRSLVDAAAADPFYRDDTCFVIVPDCGRDANPMLKIPYQHHFNSRSAREIWALVVGPGIERGRWVDREVQQTDVASTVSAYMDFDAPKVTGEVLREAFAVNAPDAALAPAPARAAPARFSRYAWAPIRFIVAVVAAQSLLGGLLLLGYVQARVRARVESVWFGRRFDAPAWLSHPGESSWLRRRLGGLLTHARRGLQALVAGLPLWLPAGAVLAFSWYAGWNNSFTKGYENAAVGPLLGFLGVAIAMLVFCYLPLAQARLAVTDDWRVIYQWRLNGRLFSARPLLLVTLPILGGAVALAYLAPRGLLTFAPNFPVYAAFEDRPDVFMRRWFFWWGVPFVAGYVWFRARAARIYASCVLRSVERGRVSAADLHPVEIDLLTAAGHAGQVPANGRATWRDWLKVLWPAPLWFAVMAMLYVTQFLNYGGAIAWLNHPLALLPTVNLP